MELGFSSTTLSYLKPVLREHLCSEESIDVIVPDTSPDVERVISVNAVPVLRAKECRNGSVSVSGGIRCTVIYFAEREQQPRFLDVYLPYSLRAENSLICEEASIVFSPWVRSADAKVVNSRKLTVRVDLCGCLRVFLEQADEVPRLETCPESLQIKNQTYSLVMPVEISERSFRMSEELQFPQNHPLSGAILFYEPRLELTEKRLAGNKSVFKGLVHFSILYESEGQRLCSMNTELPFTQYCELRDLYENDDQEMVLAVTGCEVERTTRQDGDGIILTVHILAQSIVSSRKELVVCGDAYSLDGRLVSQWKDFNLCGYLDRQSFTRTVRESWQGSVSEVISVRPYLEEPFLQITENGAELVVNGNVKVLYRDTDKQPQETVMRMSIREPMQVSDNVNCQMSVSVTGEPTVLPTGGGMELRCAVHISVLSMSEQPFCTLSGGVVQEESEKHIRPALIVRRTLSGEPLWDIAKANATTVERIRRANRLDSDETEAGILLIPT